MTARTGSQEEACGRLGEARAYLCLDSDLVSGETGISRDELAAVESGARAATELELKRLSRFYGYSVAYLRGENEPLDPDSVHVLTRWAEDLSDGDREEAMRFARYLRSGSAG